MNATATPLPVTGHALDDWFSPILIKELRQGMRGRVFVISFLILQAFLILLVLGNVAAATQGMLLQVQTGFFWGILGVALTVLMPMRGLNAVSQEVKRNTMETVLLTRMTSWRVVFGKWSALFAQSLLLATAVMPYVVVRYFIGGTDVVAELLTLLYLLWVSGIMIALAITASGINHIVIRILFVGAAGLVALAEASAVFGLMRTFSWITLGWLVLTTFCVPALLFELALAGIAPPSENHSARRRLLALAYFGLSLALWTFYPGSDQRALGLMLPLGALVGICYFELSEKPRLFPRLIVPLNRFGELSRIPGMLFLPGWPSALLFTLIFIPLAIWWAIGNLPNLNSMEGLETPLSICSLLGSILIPACFCHLLWGKLKQVFFAVMIYNAGITGLFLVLRGFDQLTHGDFLPLISLCPSVSTLMVLSDKMTGNAAAILLMNLLTLAIVLLILFSYGMRYFRDLRTMLRLEHEAEKNTE